MKAIHFLFFFLCLAMASASTLLRHAPARSHPLATSAGRHSAAADVAGSATRAKSTSELQKHAVSAQADGNAASSAAPTEQQSLSATEKDMPLSVPNVQVAEVGNSGKLETVCPLGSAADASGRHCYLCASGTYKDDTVTACTACPAGHWSHAGSSKCSACPAGTYNELPSQPGCTSCGEGFYNPKAASTSAKDCQACPAGNECPRIETPTPEGCPDAHVSVEGAAACRACPAFFTASADGKVCTPRFSFYALAAPTCIGLFVLGTIWFIRSGSGSRYARSYGRYGHASSHGGVGEVDDVIGDIGEDDDLPAGRDRPSILEYGTI